MSKFKVGDRVRVTSPADDFQERESFDVVDACYYGLWVEKPTHWLPLPSAPNQAKEAGE